MDGALCFTGGPGTLKSRTLAANPACSVSVRSRGIDLVLEGEAQRVTGASTLGRAAAVYPAGGWPASVDGDALTARTVRPGAGPAPWYVHRRTLHTGSRRGQRRAVTRNPWDFAY